ncbi:MAG: choice-of-anchor Q domain-containing protein, partial [Actinomycetota bacterium]
MRAFPNSPSHQRLAAAAVGALIGAALVVAGTPPVHASTTINVATTTELRAAVSTLNAAGDGLPDTIALTGAGPYLLSCGTDEDANLDGDLDITGGDDLTITFPGPGHATIAIDQSGGGCATERVIDHLASAALTLERVRVADGDLSATTATGNFDRSGGGLRFRFGSSLQLIDVILENNRAADGSVGAANGGSGGGVAVWSGSLLANTLEVHDNHAGDGATNPAGSGGSGGQGGGIFSQRSIDITDGTFTGNRSGSGGGGQSGGSGNDGGALASTTTVTLADVTFTANHAGDGGGGTTGSGGSGGDAGAVSVAGSASLTIDGVSAFDGNHAGDGGDGSSAGGGGGSGGAIQFAGGDADASVDTTDDVAIDGATFDDNSAGSAGTGGAGVGGDGGAINLRSFGVPDPTARLTNTRFDGNIAGRDGGAVAAALDASLHVATSTIIDNTAGDDGGGLHVGGSALDRPSNGSLVDSAVTGNTATAGDGGGLRLSAGEFEVRQSTIHGNSAGDDGGGIGTFGDELYTIVNSTIDNNTAAGSGGGVWMNAPGSATISATTITSNDASTSAEEVAGGGGSGTLTIERSAIGGSPGGANNCSNVDVSTDVVEDGGVQSCGLSTTVASLELSGIGDHGGPTATRFPLTASPLLDVVSCVEITDQRGFARPLPALGSCDVGAVEADDSTTIDPTNPPLTLSPTNVTVSSSAELRSAIDNVNDALENTAPDTITLGNAGPFELACGTNEDVNADGDLDIDTGDDVTITFAGPGRAIITVADGCTTERVIDHHGAGALTIERVIITGGDLSTASHDIERNASGGGLRSDGSGDVTLTDVAVTANEAGDGANSTGSGDGGSGGGVAIFGGSLSITDSEIDDNRAGDGADDSTNSFPAGDGGGVYVGVSAGDLTVDSTSITANEAGDGGTGSADPAGRGGRGGGIASFGATAITDSTIGGAAPTDGNNAGTGGDATAAAVGGDGGDGGGVWTSGDLTMQGGLVANNSSGDGGSGNGGNGGSGGDGAIVVAAASVDLDEMEIVDNRAGSGGDATTGTGGAGGNGGGVSLSGTGLGDDIDLDDVVIDNNRAGDGGNGQTGGAGGSGGGGSLATATVTVDGSTVTMNTAGEGGSGTTAGAVGHGGGLAVVGAARIGTTAIESNQAGDGGGVSLSGSGLAELDRSTIATNDAGRFGGGVYATGDQAVMINNSTVSDNVGDVEGGGLWSNGIPAIDVEASTIASNRAPLAANLRTDPGGAGSLDIVRSAVGDPLGSPLNCVGVGAPDVPDTTGTIEASASSVTTCGATPPTVLVDDLQLASLDDNGGPTRTRSPLASSPLIDGLNTCVESIDQRGTVRPVGGRCDVGAVEANDTVPDAFSFTPQTGVDLASQRTSNEVTLAGFNLPAAISVTAGTYSVNDSPFTAAPGVIEGGDRLRLRHTASAATSTSIVTTVDVGDVTATFTSTTAAPSPPLPDPPEPPTPPTPTPDDVDGAVTIEPVRLLETRAGPDLDTIDGRFAGIGPNPAGTILEVDIAGRPGIP